MPPLARPHGRPLRHALWGAAALLVAVGCASRGASAGGAPGASPTGGQPDAAGAPAVNRRVVLRIESHHHADVVIHAVRGGMRQRLGMVTAATTQRLVVPARFAESGASFFLVADPVGARGEVRSPAIFPQGGQTVVWVLESDLARSMLSLEDTAAP